MSNESPTEAEKLAESEKALLASPSLKAVNRDGMAWALMVGCGETYLGPFAIFLGATPFQVAFLATVPQFFGALFQLFTVWALRFFRSRRRAIVQAASVNAFIWIPIALIGIYSEPGEIHVWALIACALCYHVSANFSAPLWNSLVGDVVPAAIRGRFFGQRNRKIGLCTFIGMLAAGYVLQSAEAASRAGIGFAAIFLVASAARFVSAFWLQKYDDKPTVHQREHYFSLWDFLRRSPRSNFARFVYYVAWINLSVALSGPFFSLYMLRQLKFSYLEFTLVSAANTVTQFLTMVYWGRISDALGNKRILNICGFGVAFAPILWIFGISPLYLIGVQTFVGLVWAGFNLAAANFLFDAVSPPKRAICAAYQSMVNGSFVLLGSLLGSFLVSQLPHSVSLAGLEWTPASPWLFLFGISGLLRIIASGIFLPLFKEVRTLPRVSRSELFVRITGLRPISGASYSIFTGEKRASRRRKPPS